MQPNTLLTMYNHLWVPIVSNKLDSLITVLTFLGTEMDRQAMQVWLPEANLVELQQMLTVWKDKRSCKRKELESLIEKLQHACTVMKPGRMFLSHLSELLSATKRDYHHTSW